MAVALSSSDDSALWYVLPVEWMTSSLSIIGQSGVYSKWLTGG